MLATMQSSRRLRSSTSINPHARKQNINNNKNYILIAAMAPAPPGKKRPKFCWKEEDMVKALKAVKENGMNPFKASRKYGVPRSTLLLKMKLQNGEPLRKRLGPECTIGTKNEKMLANWVEAMVKRGFPVTGLDLRNSVKKIIEEMKITTSFKDSRPGKRWLELFLSRHKLTMRASEKLTLSRATVSEKNIRTWFDKVDSYMKEQNIQETLKDPKRIFNMDESGFLLCPKGEKVVAQKGTRNVYQVCSNNEKESITVCFTVSAAGEIGPSLVVYPGQRYPKGLEDHIPDNWGVAKTEKGWITGETFYEFIANVFHKWLIENQITLPVVLFLDGHSSHLTYHLSQFSAENGIEIIALHPNATHILQPLDVSFFGPLKKRYAERVQRWKIENNTLVLEKVRLPELLDKVVKEDLDPSIIRNGFRVCGLYPFSAENVDYSKCVSDYQPNPQSHPAVVDVRHEHIEMLLGTELVKKYKAGQGDGSQGYAMWLKSKAICYNGKEVNNPATEHFESLSPAAEFAFEFFENSSPTTELAPEHSRNFSPAAELAPELSENFSPAAELAPEHSRNFSPAAELVPEHTGNFSPAAELAPEYSGNFSPAAELVPEHTGNFSPAAEHAPEYSENFSRAAEPTLKSSHSNLTPDKLSKVLSPETGGLGVPSPLKKALYWPGTPRKKKVVRRLVTDGFPSISSKTFRETKEKEKAKKMEAERIKEERKLKRQELKKDKEIKKKEAQEKKEKKKKKIQRSESETSNSDADITSGESVWDEAESSDEAFSKREAPERKVGEYVLVKYCGKYFPGIITEIQLTGAVVSSMEQSGGLWKWPTNKDILLYEWSDIFSKISPPVQTSKTRQLFAVKELDFQSQFLKL